MEKGCGRQLGACYTSSFMESHRLGNFGVVFVGLAIHTATACLLVSTILKPALYGLNSPGSGESPHTPLQFWGRTG
jgi:hypothetical protein